MALSGLGDSTFVRGLGRWAERGGKIVELVCLVDIDSGRFGMQGGWLRRLQLGGGLGRFVGLRQMRERSCCRTLSGL
jgi:hypothetical protein